MTSRVVLIGVDGAPSTMMDDLCRRGVMPNLAGLREEAFFGFMESSTPAVSSTSWSTIITGTNPGEHSIYGFTDVMDGTYTLSFPNYHAIKKQPYWETIDGQHVVINVPMTYPAAELSGCLISGFVSPDFERSVYPQTLVDELKSINYRTDVDASQAHKSKTLLMKQLNETLEARAEAYRMLWDRYKWKTFKLVFTGSDRLEHFLWDAYEDGGHEMHQQFLDYFTSIDEVIGEITEKMGEDDSLIILSDHGMEQVKYNVNVNAVLLKKGYLKLGDKPKQKYNNMLSETKAFALEDGRVYVNRKGRFPRGSVEDMESVVGELVEVFSKLEDNGAKIIERIHRRDEIYHGEHVHRAPDLVLEAAPGYNLRGKLTDNLFEESPLTGMHNRDAFLYVSDKDVVPNFPSVENIVPMMKELIS